MYLTFRNPQVFIATVPNANNPAKPYETRIFRMVNKEPLFRSPISSTYYDTEEEAYVGHGVAVDKYFGKVLPDKERDVN